MRFSVLTYNVLHTAAAARLLRGRAGEAVSWVSDRLPRAAEQVARLDPDVACFQEVDPAAESALERALGIDYERVVHRNEELPPKDGCAIFVRRSRFEILGSHSFRLRDTAPTHVPRHEEMRGRGFSLAAALYRELHEKLNLAVALKLRAKMPAEGSGSSGTSQAPELCVSTSHLFWDPAYPDLKLLQAFLLARELECYAPESNASLLVGDLNSTPVIEGQGFGSGAFSGVYDLLTRGSLLRTHPHHPCVMRRGSGLLRGVSADDVPELSVENC